MSGEAPQEGQPGQEGTEQGGHGGRGGHGGTGARGATGARGQRGQRGPVRKHGPLYGYIVASIIFTVLLYWLAFSARADSVLNCEQRNAQFDEVNERASAINHLIRLELSEVNEEHSPLELHSLLTLRARPVALNDCRATFAKPWPFG